jgi:hypothetical protein
LVVLWVLLVLRALFVCWLACGGDEVAGSDTDGARAGVGAGAEAETEGAVHVKRVHDADAGRREESRAARTGGSGRRVQ